MLSDYYVPVDIYYREPTLDGWDEETVDEAEWVKEKEIMGLIEPLSNNNKEWMNGRTDYIDHYILYTNDEINNQNRVKWNNTLYSIESIANIMHIGNSPHYEVLLISINEWNRTDV